MSKVKVSLREIAYGRSGDKGSNSNIGIIAYTKSGYDFLLNYLTDERIQNYFKPLKVKKTIRYQLDNLQAFNFVLYGVLDGGGSQSLRIDSQGKALAQVLLEMKIEIPNDILEKAKRQ